MEGQNIINSHKHVVLDAFDYLNSEGLDEEIDNENRANRDLTVHNLATLFAPMTKPMPSKEWILIYSFCSG